MSLELHEVSNTNKKAIDGQLAFGAIPEPQEEQSLPRKTKRKRSRLDEVKMDFRVVELKDIQRQISLQELLAPYASADIIGFSYSLDFIEKCILPHVDYCRLILGADFLRVKKGMELANQFLRVEKSNAKAIQSHPKIMEAIKDGSLEIKTAVSLGSSTPAAWHPRSLAVKAEGKGVSFPRAGGVWKPPIGQDCPKSTISAFCSWAFGLASLRFAWGPKKDAS